MNKSVKINNKEFNNENKNKLNREFGHTYTSIYDKDSGLKIAVITTFGIKKEFQGKGYGPKIINNLLKKYNYVVIRIDTTGGFWKIISIKINIHCIGDAI